MNSYFKNMSIIVQGCNHTGHCTGSPCILCVSVRLRIGLDGKGWAEPASAAEAELCEFAVELRQDLRLISLARHTQCHKVMLCREQNCIVYSMRELPFWI